MTPFTKALQGTCFLFSPGDYAIAEKMGQYPILSFLASRAKKFLLLINHSAELFVVAVVLLA